MRYTSRALILTLVAGILAGIAAGAALGNAIDDTADRVELHACTTEDSVQCYWRADTMGNGVGQSFVDLNGHLYVEIQPGQ